MRAIAAWVLMAVMLHAQNGTLRRVLDADRVSFKEGKCFLAYITTPENSRNVRFFKADRFFEEVPAETILKMGRESREHLKSLLDTGQSYKYHVVRTDRYGRKYCVIYKEGSSLNKMMIQDGYALPKRNMGEKESEYVNIALNAKSERRGLWGKYGRICTLR